MRVSDTSRDPRPIAVAPAVSILAQVESSRRRVLVPQKPITFWNRREGREEIERIYGDRALRWLYESRVGRFVGDRLLARRWMCRLCGWYWSTRRSRRRIPDFVAEYGIRMDDFAAADFRSFNEFFSRRFRPGARAFRAEHDELSAPAEGRYLAFRDVAPDQTFPVKGEHLSADAILGRDDFAHRFRGGPLVIARLCPVDYHRFHYPDAGSTSCAYRIAGKLHSVNPLALASRSDIFATNERRVSLLETEHFGAIAYVEVGALNVGRIVQTHPVDAPFARGDEKGYFLFGGSTVILFGESGAWTPDEDLVARTESHQEVFVRLGERIAQTTRA